MTKSRSIYEVLAVLGAGATLLAACGDAAPPAQTPVGGTEVPAATGAAMAPAATMAPPAPPATMAPAAPAAPPATAAAAAPPAGKAAPKPMPPKRKDSKRTADKSSAGCCGEGTCAPC